MTTDTDQQLVAERTINAPAEDIYAVLADPSNHSSIDGTGWVREQRSGGMITKAGEQFEVGMFHENAGGDYVMRNEVTVYDPPSAIAWLPIGQDPDGSWGPGGWTWRYDLTSADDGGTSVALTYDWSQVPAQLREHISFPPFPITHLEKSLANLDRLVTG